MHMSPYESKNAPHWRQKRITRKLLLVVCDLLSVVGSHLAAFLLYYNFRMETVTDAGWLSLWTVLPVNIAVSVIVFWLLRLYQGVWTFASVREMFNILVATALVAITQVGISEIFVRLDWIDKRLSMQFFVLQFFLLLSGVAGVRFLYRLVRHVATETQRSRGNKAVMIVGAGAAGAAIIRELQTSKQVRCRIVSVVDDNAYKWGSYICGCRIEGGRDSIPELVKKHGVEEIMVAMPAADPRDVRDILNICKETGCALKTLPGIYQLINDDVLVSHMRPVEVEDLLGRKPIRVDLEGIIGYLQDQVVLVTGGGGSIGSELCRQIASHHPRQLIIFDVYENNAYDIQQELRHAHPDLDLQVLIGSVRNEERLRSIFDTYHPSIVYHAAAHKHVPLMEDSPNEAIKNNVLGTYNTAKTAGEFGARRFVLISTDKAVNPTNIMGASKRLCEMIVQMMNNRYKTEFVAVRFGNVLGSNGSVVPLFRKQIEQGGPVTVTHPDIIRYFMTIPEAVSLVLQAGAFAKGGEIFVLNMGEPVKIADLARNLILLSGLKPDVDIEIRYTGLRPGEKLYEEMLMDEEGITKTDNKLIFIGHPIQFDEQELEAGLEELKSEAYGESDHIRQTVARLVPTYHPRQVTAPVNVESEDPVPVA
jgi:FlaA1/EpsC-like NDP-sugar epimerase